MTADREPPGDRPITRDELRHTVAYCPLGVTVGDRTGRLGGEQCPAASLTGGTTIRPPRQRAAVN